MTKILLGAVLTATIAFGSATILSGANQSISFNSEPEGVSVLIDGQLKCKTPCTISLEKNKYSNITFSKAGYKTQNLALAKQFDGVALLNIFWDLSTTDALTGAIYKYSPNSFMVELKPNGE